MTTFHACGLGVSPKFPYEILPPDDPDCNQNFGGNFERWQQIRNWCEEQNWKMNEDFLANAKFNGPWYFNSIDKQTWFTLRWT